MNNIYLLLGPEKGLKKEFIKTQINKILKDLNLKKVKPDIVKFYPFEENINELIQAISTPSLFNPITIIYINDCEKIKSSDMKKIEKSLKNNSNDLIIFFLSNEASQNKIANEIKKIVKKDKTVIFWEKSHNDRNYWIKNFFEKRGFSIKRDAVELIANIVENNTIALEQSCSMLLSVVEKGEVITEEIVDNFIYHSKEESAFTLFNTIAEKDLSKSIDILRKIINSGETNIAAVIGGLIWKFNQLLDLSINLEKKEEESKALQNANIRGKTNSKIYLMARKNYSLNEVKQIIIYLNKIDTILKSEKSEISSILQDLMLYHIIKKQGNVEGKFFRKL